MSHSLSIPAPGPFRTCVDWAGLVSCIPSKTVHLQWPHPPMPTTPSGMRDKLNLIHPRGFPLGVTTLRPSSGPGETCSNPEDGGTWLILQPRVGGKATMQAALLLFSELSGPGMNLAGAHGLLIFSVPGCYTTFHLKNASTPHQRARLSSERNQELGEWR